MCQLSFKTFYMIWLGYIFKSEHVAVNASYNIHTQLLLLIIKILAIF